MINNAIAHGITSHLISRNCDIDGYWGIGKLCRACIQTKRMQCGVTIYPSFMIESKKFCISGIKFSESANTIRSIIGSRPFKRIDIRIYFKKIKHFQPTGLSYKCEIIVLVAGQGAIGYSRKKVRCWPHDPKRESQRCS